VNPFRRHRAAAAAPADPDLYLRAAGAVEEARIGALLAAAGPPRRMYRAFRDMNRSADLLYGEAARTGDARTRSLARQANRAGEDLYRVAVEMERAPAHAGLSPRAAAHLGEALDQGAAVAGDLRDLAAGRPATRTPTPSPDGPADPWHAEMDRARLRHVARVVQGVAADLAAHPDAATLEWTGRQIRWGCGAVLDWPYPSLGRAGATELQRRAIATRAALRGATDLHASRLVVTPSDHHEHMVAALHRAAGAAAGLAEQAGDLAGLKRPLALGPGTAPGPARPAPQPVQQLGQGVELGGPTL